MFFHPYGCEISIIDSSLLNIIRVMSGPYSKKLRTIWIEQRGPFAIGKHARIKNQTSLVRFELQPLYQLREASVVPRDTAGHSASRRCMHDVWNAFKIELSRFAFSHQTPRS